MTARVIAQQILTAEGHPDPRPVPLHDQAILARAYLSLTEGGTTLAATGAGSNNLDLRSHTNRRHAP